MQVILIILALPTSLNLQFPYALEHTVTPASFAEHNLGPPTSESCRSLTWDVEGGLEVQQVLIIRRCLKSQFVPARGVADGLYSKYSSHYVTVQYNPAGAALYFNLPPTQSEDGRAAEVKTHVLRPTDRVDFESIEAGAVMAVGVPLHGGFDIMQLEPFFVAATSNNSCQVAPGGCECPGVGDGAVQPGCVAWVLRCTGIPTANSTALSAALHTSFISMTTQALTQVDLRVADKQSNRGFAGGLEMKWLDAWQDSSDSEGAKEALQAFAQSLTGDKAVVARVVTSRVNLLSALIMAALAAMLYQLTQLRDNPSAALALHCLSEHGGHSPSPDCGSSDDAELGGKLSGKGQEARAVREFELAMQPQGAAPSVAGQSATQPASPTLPPRLPSAAPFAPQATAVPLSSSVSWPSLSAASQPASAAVPEQRYEVAAMRNASIDST